MSAPARSFRYRARDGQGRWVRGCLEATDAGALELLLSARGLELADCRPAWRRPRRMGRRELIAFCFQMEQGLRAGIPILDCLAGMRDEAEDAAVAAVVADIAASVEGGSALSAAMERHPGAFPELVVRMVDTGERCGELPRIFAQLAESLKWQDELASRLRRMLIYPALVFVTVTAVIVVLMVTLVPQLVALLQDLGRTLPLPTKILLRVSGFLRESLPWLPVVVVLSAAAVSALRFSPALRYRLDVMLLRLPGLGGVLRKAILARIASIMHLMYGSGISLLECVDQGARLAGNRVIERAMRTAGAHIRAGSGLAAGFRRTGVFPHLVLHMLGIGESTGSLERALREVCYFYERDVREASDRLQALIGPALTVTLGAVLVWIVLAVLGPVYDLALSLPG